MQITMNRPVQFGCTAQIMMLKAKQKLAQFLKDRNIAVEGIAVNSQSNSIDIQFADDTAMAQAKEALKSLKELKLNKDGSGFTYGLADVNLTKTNAR